MTGIYVNEVKIDLEDMEIELKFRSSRTGLKQIDYLTQVILTSVKDNNCFEAVPIEKTFNQVQSSEKILTTVSYKLVLEPKPENPF